MRVIKVFEAKKQKSEKNEDIVIVERGGRREEIIKLVAGKSLQEAIKEAGYLIISDE